MKILLLAALVLAGIVIAAIEPPPLLIPCPVPVFVNQSSTLEDLLEAEPRLKREAMELCAKRIRQR